MSDRFWLIALNFVCARRKRVAQLWASFGKIRIDAYKTANIAVYTKARQQQEPAISYIDANTWKASSMEKVYERVDACRTNAG